MKIILKHPGHFVMPYLSLLFVAGTLGLPTSILAANHVPVIKSLPAITATTGQAYTYDVNATDIDGNKLTYALITKPGGMAINSRTGVISWKPSKAGNFYVVVAVTDDKSGRAIQKFTLTTKTKANKEWFVSTTGSDKDGNGSITKPFRTVKHVLTPTNKIVRAGDIVTLRGPKGKNTYNECKVRLRVPLTLRSYSGEFAHIHCKIEPTNDNATATLWLNPTASGSTLSRLEISGGNLYGIYLHSDWDPPANGNTTGKGTSNVIMDALHVHDTGRDGIKITPKSNDATIRNSEIANTGKANLSQTVTLKIIDNPNKNADGIDNVQGHRMHVMDTYIHDIPTNGLYFKGGATDVIIERNTIERTGLGGVMVGFDTSPEFFDTKTNPNYYEAIRGVVRNNLVRDTDHAGIGLYAAKDAIVANNTLIHTANSGHAALYFGITLQDGAAEAKRPASINPTIRNNLVIQANGACLGIRWDDILGNLSGLSGNPGSDYNWFYSAAGACHFFDGRPGKPLADGGPLANWRKIEKADTHSKEGKIAVLEDGHLLTNSPAIDKGQTLSSVTEDIDRQKRQAPFDIGFDEVIKP